MACGSRRGCRVLLGPRHQPFRRAARFFAGWERVFADQDVANWRMDIWRRVVCSHFRPGADLGFLTFANAASVCKCSGRFVALQPQLPKWSLPAGFGCLVQTVLSSHGVFHEGCCTNQSVDQEPKHAPEGLQPKAARGSRADTNRFRNAALTDQSCCAKPLDRESPVTGVLSLAFSRSDNVRPVLSRRGSFTVVRVSRAACFATKGVSHQS